LEKWEFSLTKIKWKREKYKNDNVKQAMKKEQEKENETIMEKI
jgi:hypothetical protein